MKPSIKDQADIFALLQTEGPMNQSDIHFRLDMSPHRIRKAVHKLAKTNAIVLADTSGNQKQWKVRPPSRLHSTYYWKCPYCPYEVTKDTPKELGMARSSHIRHKHPTSKEDVEW